jgi:integrase
MATITLTKRAVDAAEPGDHDRFLFDATIKGFAVKITRNGCKSYILQYRVTGGRNGAKRRLTIGKHGSPWTVESARKEAIRLLTDVRAGIDPAEVREEDRTAQTVADFVHDHYLPEHVLLHKKSAADDVRYFDKFILPAIGRRRLKDVTKQHIVDLKVSLARTPIAANRVIGLVSHMFGYAGRGGDANPASSRGPEGIKRFRERKIKRYLSEAELADLNAALAAQRDDLDPIAACIKLLIYTGARKSEILTLRWSYVDFDRGIALLPDSKEGGDKTLYLSGPALDILAALPRVEGNPFVLPGLASGTHLTSSGLHKGFGQVRRAAGLDNVRVHDLRHSYASFGIGAAGLNLPAIGELLGHKKVSTTMRYAHLASDPMHKAAGAIAAKLAAIMVRGSTADGEGRGGVVRLRKEARP